MVDSEEIRPADIIFNYLAFLYLYDEKLKNICILMNVIKQLSMDFMYLGKHTSHVRFLLIFVLFFFFLRTCTSLISIENLMSPIA